MFCELLLHVHYKKQFQKNKEAIEIQRSQNSYDFSPLEKIFIF